MNTFSKWMITEREKRGWSQAELARKSGLSRMGLSNIERGRRKPNAQTCTAIAKAFNYPVEEVFRLAGLLPMSVEADGLQARLDHIFNSLSSSTNKQLVIDFVELIKTKE